MLGLSGTLVSDVIFKQFEAHFSRGCTRFLQYDVILSAFQGLLMQVHIGPAVSGAGLHARPRTGGRWTLCWAISNCEPHCNHKIPSHPPNIQHLLYILRSQICDFIPLHAWFRCTGCSTWGEGLAMRCQKGVPIPAIRVHDGDTTVLSITPRVDHDFWSMGSSIK